MCRTSLVFPKHSVLRISTRSTNSTVLTITQRSIIETSISVKMAMRNKKSERKSQLFSVIKLKLFVPFRTARADVLQ